MKKMRWDIKKIVNWSQRKLKNLTAWEQRRKSDLEALEYLEASSMPDQLEELADFYITQVILAYRFGNPAAKVVCLLFQWAFMKDKDSDFEKAVDIKMDINEQRTFVKINGEHRHIRSENDYFLTTNEKEKK
ncbi:MAG: hypothetical protein IJ660_00905 [Alphaproteobacteria bacterium]|nr:hypothetical protein [Alphaproteobacteria bacterium]